MQIDVLEGQYPTVATEVLILGFFEDDGITPAIKYFDEPDRLAGLIQKAVQKKQLTGEYKQLKAFTLQGKLDTLLLIGLGKKAQWSLERLRRVCGITAKAARLLGKTAITNLHTLGPSTPAENAKAVAMGSLLGLYEFTKYKTADAEKRKVLDHLTILDTEKQKADLTRGVQEGIIIAESTNIARDLVNTPAKDLTPKVFAAEAKRLLKPAGVTVDVWDRKDCEKKGMHAFLGVSAGSDEEPQFIIAEYGSKKQKPIVLVGKGVTFDTGGLSIKYPYTSMLDMKMDMAGGAAVLTTLRACALLKVPQHIIAIVPATENAINGKAQKPGDVVKAMNGKTIEIANTDAEGRLILADALSYAETLQPQLIVDIATLTGSCQAALGFAFSGLFTRDEELRTALMAAGVASGDALWSLPLTDDYVDNVKSDVADMRNIGKDPYAGATIGAIFLEKFVAKTPWAHLDIAGPAFLPDEREYNPKGASGCGVRLLTEFVQRRTTG